MSQLSRLESAVELLLQSPPGQTLQVYHDLRGILLDPQGNSDGPLDDAKIQVAVARAIEDYNTRQLIPVSLSGDESSKNSVILSKAGQLAFSSTASQQPGVQRYIHPRAQKSFLFDHLKRVVTEVESIQVDEQTEKIRSALDEAFQSYVADRYPDGVSSVFSTPPVAVLFKAQTSEEAQPFTEAEEMEEKGEEQKQEQEQEQTQQEQEQEQEEVENDLQAEEQTEEQESTSSTEPVQFTIQHVCNRYNLSNFWSGRWRASYTFTPSQNTLTSLIQIQVHYFENGNVQLNTKKQCTFQLDDTVQQQEQDPKAIADALVKVVQAHEDGFQTALDSTYDQLGEKAFKALRRQLPVTRSKLDWDKVLNYKLGSELSKA